MKAHRKPLFIALFIAVAGIWLYNAFLLSGGRIPAKAETKQLKTVAALDTVVYVYAAKNRDPFECTPVIKAMASSTVNKARKPENARVSLPRLSIGGIVYSQNNPMALFNYNGKSTLIKQGDVIDSMLIKSIEKDSVRIEYKGKMFSIGK
jgi:type II secretory pathway component PulC